jgi:hypothetical protein
MGARQTTRIEMARCLRSWREIISGTATTPGGKGGWFCHTPSVAVARALGAKAVGAKRALEWR